MKAAQKRSPDVDVAVAGNTIRSRLATASLIAIIPVCLVFAWIGLIREPAVQSASVAALATKMADSRALQLSQYAQDLVARTLATAARTPADSGGGAVDPAFNGFPDATSVTVIPLDDLGTVNLEPGQYGIRSHIGVDVVRKAYGNEEPAPEVVGSSAGDYTLVARPFGEPMAGVVLVELSNDRLQQLLNPTEAGQFRLLQRHRGETGKPVVGALGGNPDASAAVDKTLWTVEFRAEPSWTAGIVPGWLELAIGASIAVIGVLVGVFSLVNGVPKALRREVTHIVDSAELRSPMKVRIPELLPLAKTLRQLSLLSRRQIASKARQGAVETTDELDATEETAQESESPEALGMEGLSTPPRMQEATELDGADTQSNDDDEDLTDGIGHLFRGTCIRGDANEELTDEMVERIGRGLAVTAGDRGIKSLLVGHDTRESSVRIRTGLVKALLAGGIDVVDLGLVPTPLVYFATHETDTTSGVMITGGHSPESVNGFKIVLEQQVLAGEGLRTLLDNIRDNRQVQGSGHAAKYDIESDYVDRIAMDVALALPLRVVVDTQYGAASHLAATLFEALDCEVVAINQADAGNRPEVWDLEEGLAALGARVEEEGADIGVIFNGDGGRLHTVTNAGRAVATDQLLMLLASDMLERNPGADIVYDVTFTRHFAPFVTRAGGRALMSRSGDAFVREKMLESNAVLAGDFSGHIFMEERWYGFDDSIYAFARLLEILAGASATYDELVAALPRAAVTPEVFLDIDEGTRRHLMKSLVANADFPGARVTTLDGLRVDYADGWGIVRGSTTDSALTLRFEGNDDSSLKRVQGAMREALQEAEPELELPF